MNYELARALKENMFKQNGMGYYITRLSKPLKTSAKAFRQVEGKKPYVPVLHELIEACGYKFYSLTSYAQKTLSGDGKDEWVAKAWQVEKAKGSTPEEAVAKLWLALNTYDEEGNKLNKNPIVIKEGKGLF